MGMVLNKISNQYLTSNQIYFKSLKESSETMSSQKLKPKSLNFTDVSSNPTADAWGSTILFLYILTGQLW